MPSEQRDWKFRVRHIIEAARKILDYTGGMNREQFLRDGKTLDAVVRNFMVIGEAARRIPQDVALAHPEVPWADMRAMRNVLAHDYDRVDADVVWKGVTEDLPKLIPLLTAILEEEDR